MPKRKPQRTCIGCRQVRTKRAMIRLVRTPEGDVVIDESGKRSGRGAYICAVRDCWHKALDQRNVGRALRMTLSAADLDQLRSFADRLPESDDEDTNE